MSWAGPDGPCPTCGVNVDPWIHDCPVCPTAATLTEFLLARIAEDEVAARRAIAGDVRELPFITCQCGRTIHLGLSDPARVLAECAAKRGIVKLYGPIQLGEGADGYPVPLGGDGPQAYWDALCLLALPYDDHPDYQPEWRP